jgi:hypothetical protein
VAKKERRQCVETVDMGVVTVDRESERVKCGVKLLTADCFQGMAFDVM